MRPIKVDSGRSPATELITFLLFMARTFEIPDTALGIGERVFIRKPTPEDEKPFVSQLLRSKSFHYPWISHEIKVSFFQSYLLRFESHNEGHLVCSSTNGAMLGVININDIVKGVLQCGFLGFYAFVQHAGQGYMSEGLTLVTDRAFSSLNLHRLEANIQPRNHRSKNFVKKHGFNVEGYSRRFLKVAGRWKDHERWALLKEEWLERQKK